LTAAFAGLLDDRVIQVTIKHALRSYAEVAETEDYKWPYAALLPDVLRQFDLPDLYRELESKKLANVESWGATDGML
jgi:hypothetical protein